MEHHNLFTRDGGFVTSVMIPALRPMAEILLWGSRYFIWSDHHAQYREGICYPTNVIVQNNDPQPQV